MTFESIIPFFAGEGNFFHKIFKLSDETGRGGCVGAAGGCDAGELLRRQGGFRKKGPGACQAFSKILQHQMDFFQPSEACADLAGFPDTGLEIIAFYRKIVGISGGSGFLKGAVFPIRIDAPVIHVVTQQIRPAPKHADGLCLDIFRRRPRPSVSGNLKSASQLRSEIRVL